jgi:hypothetical protein
LTRRELLQQTALLAAASQLGAGRSQAAPAGMSTYEWIRSPRILIAEAYNPPFYPAFDYVPEKAIKIARELNADSLRYPAASYFAYFPTKSGYPIHPELKGDPMKETIERAKDAGLRVVAYVPFNHPFMDSTSKDPRYADWSKKFASGKPMITTHYGYATFFEGCLNSPLREVIRTLVREVLTQYPVDVMYFDGPYQGMNHGHDFCHCKYCEAAYRKKFNKPVPDQDAGISHEDDIQYQNWMANDVAIAFFHEIREMIRTTRDVPVLFNDTALLSRREWRSHAIPVADGFMFEAAETPEEKLFNMQLGQSTGKVIWTYVGSHTEYNREHLKDTTVRGWYSYPLESQELLLDGATAVASGVGLVYWSLSRFFYQPDSPLNYESGRYVKTIFDIQQKYDALLRTLKPRPQVGVMVGGQTIDWYTGKHFVSRAYSNYFHGAYRLLKANSIESEPFLDWEMTPALLARYKMIYAPNCACLSDAQCEMLRDYVRHGGILMATHLTSVADEHGRVRKDFGLADVFGASFLDPEPIEMPDLYLRTDDEIPQDPQVMLIRATTGKVLGETIDRGHRKTVGPAGVGQRFGDGNVTYIASGYEAVYEETEMPIVRTSFGKLFQMTLGDERSYNVEYQPGLTPHLMASERTLVLHLLANTGNKNKHLRPREGFVPITDVKVRIHVAKQPVSVSLMGTGEKIPVKENAGWIEVTVPRVLIHEAVRVDLA